MKSVVRITNQGKVKDVPPTHLTTVPELDEVDTTVACIQALIPVGLAAVYEELSKERTRLAGRKHSRTDGLPGWSAGVGSGARSTWRIRRSRSRTSAPAID